ncbi:MAG TPA: phage tail tape measure protein, partial [Hyphomicrobium sp.]|nr:phage tail tape measure protein [Hyphomicrobium sp.]
VEKMAGAVGRVRTQLDAIEKFNATKLGFAGAQQNFRQMQEAVEGTARALRNAEAPTRQMQVAHERAQRAVTAAARAFDLQRNSVLSAKRALEGHGIPINQAVAHQHRLAAAVDKANAALDRQQKRAARRQSAAHAVTQAGGVIGGYAGAHRVKSFAGQAIEGVSKFDIGVRSQREFAGISEDDQKKLLIPQAKRIGQDTQFTNLDIVEAQTAVMQRLPERVPRAQVAHGITEEVKNYALAMRADMKRSAEAITAFLMNSGKDISNGEKALANARAASNMLIRMGKLGGMSDDDIQGFTRYGVASGSLAGLSDSTIAAFGIGLKRAGFQGDAAGVALRTMSAKLVSPTSKGMDALAAMGIDYNKYTTMPEGGFSMSGLKTVVGQTFGKKIPAAMQGRIEEVLADPEAINDRIKFVTDMSAVLSELFPGGMGAKDANKLGNSLGRFYKNSVESVDTEGLLKEILSKPRTLAQLNSYFTDKHGGKVGAVAKTFENFMADKAALEAIPADYGKKIADAIMAGIGGALERLKGSKENLLLSTGEAWEPALKPTFDVLGNSMDQVSNMKPGALMAVSGVGAAATIWGAAALGKGLMSGFGLAGSAVALDGAAAALLRAAGALGAPDVPGGPPGKDKAKGKGRNAWDFLNPLVLYAAYQAGGELVGGAFNLLPQPNYPAGYDPKAELDKSPWQRAGDIWGQIFSGPYDSELTKGHRRGTMRDVYRNTFNEERQRLGIPMIGGAANTPWGKAPFGEVAPWPAKDVPPVKAELSGIAKVTGEAKITIDIPGMPSRTVNVPLNGTVNANGPGSLGVSSPDTMPGGAP